jgi:hypothetical protein
MMAAIVESSMIWKSPRRECNSSAQKLGVIHVYGSQIGYHKTPSNRAPYYSVQNLDVRTLYRAEVLRRRFTFYTLCLV